MGKSANHLFNIFKKDKVFGLSLAMTLIFFMYKGILYALIGSFVPLLIILTILGLILFSLKKSPKSFKRSIGLWSSLVILWSTVRLLLSATNEFIKPIPEGHIDGQLGSMSVLLSMIFLCAGIYMWKNRKRIMASITPSSSHLNQPKQ
jgi:cell division protein FtsX